MFPDVRDIATDNGWIAENPVEIEKLECGSILPKFQYSTVKSITVISPEGDTIEINMSDLKNHHGNVCYYELPDGDIAFNFPS